jgi:hypothetical protein
MLHGCDAIVNRELGLSDVDYRSETAARRVSQNPPNIRGEGLVRLLYDRIERNWDHCPGRSKELWRWRALPYISEYNQSPEKTLEKAIVDQNCGYVNQIPAASGLLYTCEERHVSIDLGRRVEKAWFELIELKAGDNADTPLRAAFQILGYGLLYCFARLHCHEIAVPCKTGVLAAKRIDLKVLGPSSVYLGYNIGWLARAIEQGLVAVCREEFGPRLEMHFGFEAFAPDFRWPGCDPDTLPGYLDSRCAYAWPFQVPDQSKSVSRARVQTLPSVSVSFWKNPSRDPASTSATVQDVVQVPDAKASAEGGGPYD